MNQKNQKSKWQANQNDTQIKSITNFLEEKKDKRMNKSGPKMRVIHSKNGELIQVAYGNNDLMQEAEYVSPSTGQQ